MAWPPVLPLAAFLENRSSKQLDTRPLGSSAVLPPLQCPFHACSEWASREPPIQTTSNSTSNSTLHTTLKHPRTDIRDFVQTVQEHERHEKRHIKQTTWQNKRHDKTHLRRRERKGAILLYPKLSCTTPKTCQSNHASYRCWSRRPRSSALRRALTSSGCSLCWECSAGSSAAGRSSRPWEVRSSSRRMLGLGVWEK